MNLVIYHIYCHVVRVWILPLPFFISTNVGEYGLSYVSPHASSSPQFWCFCVAPPNVPSFMALLGRYPHNLPMQPQEGYHICLWLWVLVTSKVNFTHTTPHWHHRVCQLGKINCCHYHITKVMPEAENIKVVF
jgi:hypothetical protein